jgi:hypothetical protein
MSTTPPPDQPIAENDSALAKEMPRNEPSASSEANGPSRLRRRPSEEAKAQPSHTSSSPSLSTKNANKQVTWVTPPGKFGAVDKNEEAEAVRKKGMFRRVMAKLPDWLAESLVNKRKWKTFIRCMIAVLATMVLMLVQNCGFETCVALSERDKAKLTYAALNVLGQAAFFGLIVSSPTVSLLHHHPAVIIPPPTASLTPSDVPNATPFAAAFNLYLRLPHPHRRHVHGLGVGLRRHGLRLTSAESDLTSGAGADGSIGVRCMDICGRVIT